MITNETINCLDKIYKDNSDLNRDEVNTILNLKLTLGAIKKANPLRYVPTGRIRVTVTSTLIQNLSDEKIEKVHTFFVSDENLSIFNLSKMMLEKLKNNNNEIYSSVALLETEYEIFGCCGDINKSYPTKEYRVLEKGFKLLNEKSVNHAEAELGRILYKKL
jgi:hypothetical protein